MVALLFEPVPVKIRNVTYPSIAAAARALSLHRSSITNALNEGRLDTVGFNKRGRCIAKALTINGARYRSYYAAAVAFRRTPETIRRKVLRLGNNLTFANGRWSKAV